MSFEALCEEGLIPYQHLRSSSYEWHAMSQREEYLRTSDTHLFFMFYVYILQSITFPREVYTGFSQYIDTRVNDHNAGKSIHTAKFAPWKLLWYGAFPTKEQALAFERYLKTSSGIAFRNKRLIP